MKRTIAALMAISALGAAGCAREQVYGYCGEGDTCRYEGDHTVVVRTYSGFIEPGAADFAAVEKVPEGSAPLTIAASAAADAASSTGSTPAVVTISN